MASSAYRSVLQYFRAKGRSFVNKRKSMGPSIEPWGTSIRTWAYVDRPLILIEACLRLEPSNCICTKFVNMELFN